MAERDKGHPEERDIDPDAPPSADEIAAAARLRDALAESGALGDVARPFGLAIDARGPSPAASLDASSEVELALALKAAWTPSALDAETHRALFDDLPNDEELALAGRLRDALAAHEPSNAHRQEGGLASAAHDPFAELAVALRMASSPGEISAREHEAMIAAAVAKLPRRGRVIRVAFGAAVTALAAAAGILLAVGRGAGPSEEAKLAPTRSTQDLFSEPFRAGEASARIDTIAVARASDFRDNRFRAWGVR